jgi:hypothetical protein
MLTKRKLIFSHQLKSQKQRLKDRSQAKNEAFVIRTLEAKDERLPDGKLGGAKTKTIKHQIFY